MRIISLRSLILVLAMMSGAVFGADTAPSSPPPKPKDADLERARDAIARQDWGGAQKILQVALDRDPKNADYHNLYAYSTRKGPNPDMSAVFKHYNEALALNPQHRGAHEYLGEAYLMVGNVAKAKEHLAQLDKLCFFGCTEYTDLKNAIGAYETKTVSK